MQLSRRSRSTTTRVDPSRRGRPVIPGWSTRLACCFRRLAGFTATRMSTHAGLPNLCAYRSGRCSRTQTLRVSAAGRRRRHASRVLHRGGGFAACYPPCVIHHQSSIRSIDSRLAPSPEFHHPRGYPNHETSPRLLPRSDRLRVRTNATRRRRPGRQRARFVARAESRAEAVPAEGRRDSRKGSRGTHRGRGGAWKRNRRAEIRDAQARAERAASRRGSLPQGRGLGAALRRILQCEGSRYRAHAARRGQGASRRAARGQGSMDDADRTGRARLPLED